MPGDDDIIIIGGGGGKSLTTEAKDGSTQVTVPAEEYKAIIQAALDAGSITQGEATRLLGVCPPQ